MNIFNIILSMYHDVIEVFTVLKKAADAGFNVIQLHPVFQSTNGSPYAQSGSMELDKRMFPGMHTNAECLQMFKVIIAYCHALNMMVIVDFVANHLSADTDLLRSNPGYFLWNGTEVVHPVDSGGRVYFDIAKLNYANEEVLDFQWNRLKFLLEMSVDGVRADMAGYIDKSCYDTLISRAKSFVGDKTLIWIAESFGLDEEKRDSLVRQGFQVFNSSNWYPIGIREKWLIKEMIRFPESVSIAGNHDTERLYNRFHDPLRIRQFIAFNALISENWSLTSGDEIGFDRNYDAFSVEKINEDSCHGDFLPVIRQINTFKRNFSNLCNTFQYTEGNLTKVIKKGKSSGYIFFLNTGSDRISISVEAKTFDLGPYAVYARALDQRVSIQPLVIGEVNTKMAG